MNGIIGRTAAAAAFALLLLLAHVNPLHSVEAKNLRPPNSAPAPERTPPDATALLSSLSTVLQWTSPLNATQVELQVLPAANDGPALDLILGDPLIVAAGQYALAAPRLGEGNYFLLPGMTYTWRVRFASDLGLAGLGDAAWGAWSPGGSFRTPAPSSAPMQPAFPADGAVVADSGPVTLQWSHPDPSLFYFEVQVSGDGRFDTNPATASSFVWWNLVHAGQSLPLSSWRTPSLSPGAAYYWRARPRVQGDGMPVAWSATWRFTAPGAPPPPAPTARESLESQMLALVNQERAVAGLPALTMSEAIREVARQHSDDMVARQYFAHDTPEGLNPFDRMRAVGIPFGYAGENIAFAATVARAHTALMNSPGHRANILSANYRRVGIGITQTGGGVMITQDFTD